MSPHGTSIEHEVKVEGKRHYWCRECTNADARARRKRKRRKEFDLFAQAINENTRLGTPVAPLVSAMVSKLGGVSAVVEQWMESFDWARERKKCSLSFRHWNAIINLWKFAETERPRPGEMTDEELELDAWREVVEILDRNPELVHWAANRHGFRLVPIDEAGVADRGKEDGGGEMHSGPEPAAPR